MPSFNKIVIVGHLGRDPETRYLTDGTAVTSFSVATTERTKRGGENQDITTWFKINVWGKQGEACAQYLTKGSQAYISGRLSAQEYTDRDGNKRTSLEVRADDVQFLDRKPQGDSQPADELEGARQYQERKAQKSRDNSDSEIPF
jgi:single-strand DNA-binding protein